MPPDLQDLADSCARALAAIDAVRVAWLFGSRVRGGARVDSDLDVAVRYPRELDAAGRERVRRAVVAALTDALGRVGERADVVDVDEADSAVAFAAVQGGLRLLARTDAERIDAEVRILRRYDDDRPRRELFRQAALDAARRMGEEASRAR